MQGEPKLLPRAMQVIEKLLAKENLTEQESSQALKALIQGAEVAQMAAFLVLLRAKVWQLHSTGASAGLESFYLLYR